MADIPIIMSAPMVLALLAGRKTMTRRLAWHPWSGPPRLKATRWQRVKPGDRLWVRENLAAMGNWGLWHDAGPIPKAGAFLDDIDPRGRALLDRYAPTEATDSARIPSIHMPRWASRLTLVVEATKIERVQEISARDVLAEGAPVVSSPDQPEQWMVEISAGYYQSPRLWFHRLWDSLHGAGTWDANPEVVALSFKVHQKNIDSMEKAA